MKKDSKKKKNKNKKETRKEKFDKAMEHAHRRYSRTFKKLAE